MRYVTNDLTAENVRREERGGRTYLVAPVVMAREMVLNYPEFDRREYLPGEHLEESAPAWRDQPITVNHPPDRGQGQTAKTAAAYTSEVVGRVFQPESFEADDGDTALRGEVWLDVEKANTLGGSYARITERLEQGETVGVSTGYSTIGDEPTAGRYNGEQYDLVQGRLVPNHLALVTTDKLARCSPGDGCAAPRLNHTMSSETTPSTDDTPPAVNDDLATRLGRSIVNAVRTTVRTDATPADECGCDDDGDACTCPDSSRTNTDDGDGDSDDDGDGDDGDSDASGDGGDGDASSAPSGGDGDADADADPSDGDTDDADSDVSDAGADDADSQSTDMGDSDSTTDDDRIDTLAEQSQFDADTLTEMDEAALDSLEATIEATADDGGDADGATAQDAGDADGDDVDVKANAIAEEVTEQVMGEVDDRLTDVEEKINAVERGVDPDDLVDRIITNSESWAEEDRDALADMKVNALQNIADDLDADDGPQANMAAVPGSVDRTNTTDDVSDVAAPGRSAYEQRQGGDS